MSDLASRLEGLSADKRALLLKKLQERAQAGGPGALPAGGAARITRRSEPAAYPLSFAQQRLWILNQLEPDSAFYNIPLALRMRGNLNISALEACLNEIVRRHEVLRTAFATDKGEPVLTVAAELRITLELADAEGPDADARGLDMAAEEACRPFDLSKAPLLRAKVIRLAPDDHLAILTMHHVATDGWSTNVLVGEIALLYPAFCAPGAPGDLHPLPELPIQYADYAEWQHGRLQGDLLMAQVTFWKEQLAGAPPRLELPTDRPRPAVQSVKGAVHTFALDAELSANLRQFALAQGASLYQVLLAAYQALLYRYTGQPDLCVGTPIANRTRPEIEGLIGFFVNTQVMRGQFGDDPSFREVLRRLQDRALAAQAHQDLPFEMLVEEIAPQRDMSITPLFQVLFSYEQRAGLVRQFPGLVVTPVDIHNGAAKFDQTFMIMDTGDGLHGAIEYCVDLWDASTIARMAGHYENLIAAAVALPDRPVASLPMLGTDELAQVLDAWNDTAVAFPTGETIHGRFERQARMTPDAVAVVAAGPSPDSPPEELTFGQLNDCAERIAQRLRRQGVGPESIVALMMERSVDMIGGIMGILKAGAAYLPLDPAYPAERLAYILEDSGAEALLTHRAVGTSARLPRRPMEIIAYEDALREPVSEQGAGARAAGPGNLAYIIYTSGSTGRPKGTMIEHRAALNLADALHRAAYASSGIDRPLRISLNAPLAFDASVQQIVMLTYGHTLVVIPQEIRGDAQGLLAFIRRQRLDQFDCVPSQLKLLIQAGLLDRDAAWVPAIIFPGGEAIDPATWHSLATAPTPQPGASATGRPPGFYNMYGPTECTVDSTTASARLSPDRPTIGGPLANVRAYVLDARLQPAPVGVPGELFLGGAGVSRGYLNRPDLTAERFLPDPFAGSASARMYRTGDLVRWLPGGRIEFLGRVDFQVKVRGFRIELGEIEDALCRHPTVHEAVVVALADARAGGDKRLVAYLVAGAGAPPPSVQELRQHLLTTLPEYMVPAAFVMLESLPRTPNGKVDRRALPAPETGKLAELGTEYVAPRTPVEQFLADRWRGVLKVERVGVTDNFFELGGNSLQAVVLTNRLQEELGVVTHVRALFMAPRIADLAAYLEEYYPDAIARIIGIPEHHEVSKRGTGYTFGQHGGAAEVDGEKVARFEAIIPPLQPRIPAVPSPAGMSEERNPPAIFVLSPPRSGSTLLRVMLAGNPALFAPPELDLLSFNTLAERRAAFSGKYRFWLEGPVKAIMELRKCPVEEAEAVMARFETGGWSAKQFYRQLQSWIAETRPSGPRLLVDKTPVYPMDANILRRMEEDFADARYIHLMRNPFATIYSFMEAKLEEIFFRWDHPFSMRELAELVYYASHRNILSFLSAVPAERQHRVWFEDLVGDPQPVMEGICRFLGIDFHPDMLEPYKGDKMTSGTRPGHQMAGDFKFYLRNRIDPKAADRWKKFSKGDTLSDLTWGVAREIGYSPPEEGAPGQEPAAARESIALPLLPRDAAGIPLEPPPLSYAQMRLWFLDQFEPGSPFYNVAAAVRLKGDLDVGALEHAIRAIVRRHEVLRTTFASENGVPRPVIATDMPLSLPVVDLRDLPPDEREAEAQRLSAEEARRPFDLARGPLIRSTLLRLGEHDYISLITMHHIVSDGWSVNIFIRELAALYEAYHSARLPLEPAGKRNGTGAKGEAVGATEPAPLAVQYSDYAAWQRKWFDSMRGQGDTLQRGGDGGTLAEQMRFWKEELAGLPPLLELPVDRPRPAVQTQNGARLQFTLGEKLTERLRSLSRKEGASLFMTLLAAYQTLLMRYTGQEDIAVGTPVAGRGRPEIAGLIGFFVNTLVMRGNLVPEPGQSGLTFRQLLQRTKATASRGLANPDVPFEMLVEQLQPQRDMNHTPLFQVMFAFQDAPLRSLSMPGLSFTPLEPDTRTAKFDLMLNIVERTDELRGALEYNTDLFDPGTASRIHGHLATLLEAIVANPDRPITLLPMLTRDEEQTLLGEWNRTATAIDTGSTLVAAFEAQVAATPDAIAVLAPPPDRGADAGPENRLTYAELNALAGEVAAALRARGVGPETVAGLMTQRSALTLAGIWGILKAGAAYLPLDPSYPAERLRYILSDSGASIVVSQRAVIEASGFQPTDLPGTVLFLEDVCRTATEKPGGSSAASDSPAVNGAHLLSPDSLAYVIYTSGSTGRPKGVMIQHRSALNLAGALHKVAYAHSRLGRPLRISLNAPLAFDASVQQLIMMTQGHTLVVIPQEIRGDAPGLLSFIRRHRLDQLDCVPSQLKLLLAEGLVDGTGEWTPSIVFPGGEAIDEATWHILANAPQGADGSAPEFYNMYGPTECTVDATSVAAREAPHRPTIGRPLANARAYVLDRHMQPVPVGVHGELYLGGAGVGRGYLNRPDLTSERFLPDPSGPAGSRMYRTGDLVRWLPDGTLDFLGRVDYQVKVRGFRIELGEIEESLRKHPQVKDAVVTARHDPRSADAATLRLVAYVTPRTGETAAPLTSTVLRQHLLAGLPDYMAPSAFVILDAMPLTPNGKIDRRALPEPVEGTLAEVGNAYAAPSTPTEQALAEIWSQVLNVPRVGVNDNFFELGGDSILTIQVVARAAQAGVRVTPKHVFQAPTVAGLALLADVTPGNKIDAEQGLVTGAAPLTPIQHRFFEMGLPNPNHWNQSLLVNVHGKLEAGAMKAAVAEILRHHDALRLRFTSAGGHWQQVNAGPEGDVPFEVVDLSAMAAEARAAVLSRKMLETQVGLDIGRGPMLRIVYFDFGASDGRLLFAIHHLVVDRVSWRILLEDLNTAYEQIVAGQKAQLPAKTTAFRDWAQRLAKYAQLHSVAAEAAYWLAAVRYTTPLRPDYPEGGNTEHTTVTTAGYLDADLTSALLRDAPPVYAMEVNEILLAGLAQAFRTTLGAPHLSIDIEGHGRRDDLINAAPLDRASGSVDTSRTVGWFTSLYPVTLSVQFLDTPAAILMGIKEQLRAVPDGGFHFGLLRYLSGDRSLMEQMAALPRPQVSFNYLGQFIRREEEANAVFTPSPESSRGDHAPGGPRPYLIDVTASVYEGRLRIEWTYSSAMFSEETIHSLSDAYAGALTDLIRHCQSPEAGGYTRSDFRDVELNEDEFHGVLEELGEL